MQTMMGFCIKHGFCDCFRSEDDHISAAGFEAVRGNAKPKEFNGMIKGPGSGPSSATILTIGKSFTPLAPVSLLHV